MNRALLIWLVMGAGALPAGEAGSELAAEMFRPGLFHGDQVAASSSDGWFCLTWMRLDAHLFRCSIEVTQAFDAVMNDHSGKQVTVLGAEGTFAILRGIPSLVEGPVSTTFMGYFPLGPEASIVLGSHMEGLNLHVGAQGEGHELRLLHGGRTQVVTSLTPMDLDGLPALLWAGDLNRDGELDLLVDTTDHYNVSRWTLFLSTGDPDGGLVPTAFFTTTGC